MTYLPLLLIPGMALVDRLRGGLIKIPHLKLTYVIWPVVGLMFWGCGGQPVVAMIWSVGWLLWMLPGYMDEVDDAFDIKPPEDQVVSHSWDVTLVEESMGHNPLLEVYARAIFFIIPLCLALVYLDPYRAWLPVIPALAFYPAYWLGFKSSKTNPAMVAESLRGASFGLAMALELML